MALIDWWKRDKAQLAEKHIQQVMTFAGDGKLSDGTGASAELRAYLRNIPSELLAKYADQCLANSFPASGFALQDIVNEIGRRMGFAVTHDRHRGSPSHPGNDGIWSDPNRHSLVVEVKTTGAYTINLNTIAGYRQELAKRGEINLERSSILIVVGRQDTGELEAQIRGSRHAWDMRVISIQALQRMLRLKEEVENPAILKRMHDILIPHEFTRLDQIVEIAFAAVEDARREPIEEEEETPESESKKFVPVAFHAQRVARIEKALDISLVKQSRASFASSDDAIRVLCSVSRFHERNKGYWFAFHPHQAEFLAGASRSFVAFGCGDAKKLFLIPYDDFAPWLERFHRTEKPEGFYWHIHIRDYGKSFSMIGKSGTTNPEITKYLL